MALASITKEEAMFLHQDHYSGPFEIVHFTRAGFWDFFPYSMVHGASDLGSWSGLMSTDGKKVVVSRSSYLNVSKLKKTFEFSVNEIEKVNFGMRISFHLNCKISGLTMLYLPYKFKILLFPQILGVLGGKFLQIKVQDNFGNDDSFPKLLGNFKLVL
tara:strand:- start:53 stop:526 length:474 start_codon:yes stop_codon:yes gene_type:complete